MPPKRRVYSSVSTAEAEESPSSPAKRLKNVVFVACQRCHAHKIKCSGEQPCAKCSSAGFAEQCEFKSRDRKVTVNQSYIDLLISENQRLRESHVPVPESQGQDFESSGPLAEEAINSTDLSVRNPLIGDPWFHPYKPSAPPIFIGEAACTAFATRFRRFLTGDSSAPHIPRTQYISESQLSAAGSVDVEWPSLTHAQLLVKVAYTKVGRVYHLMLRKATLEKLKEVYQSSGFDCPVNTCKFFALFAFGEMYSIKSHTAAGKNIPGMTFFGRALHLIRILPERPSITDIESLLLLSLFSYSLNRRHSALILIGNALKLALTIGLNHNIPESQSINPVERQHRIRIWWTIYIFDRMWGSKMGLPMSIPDEDIHLEVPSSILPLQAHDDEFSDTEYLIASINLARIAGNIITYIYSRKKYQETFLQRVQKLLKALKSWVDQLPGHIKLNSKDSSRNQQHIISLHLSFNQCVILATRPTLFHVLTKFDESKKNGATNEPVSQAALTLAEACIHAAQHSHSLIVQEWIDGWVPVFGYFNAHYLFSSALILAMSSVIPIENVNTDIESFETAMDVLRCMSGSGNFAASEFIQNLESVKHALASYREAKDMPQGRDTGDLTTVLPDLAPGIPVLERNDALATVGSGANLSSNHPAGEFTTEMAFLEPTMQDFLAQSDFDLGLLNMVDMPTNDSSELYFWPTPAQWTS